MYTCCQSIAITTLESCFSSVSVLFSHLYTSPLFDPHHIRCLLPPTGRPGVPGKYCHGGNLTSIIIRCILLRARLKEFTTTPAWSCHHVLAVGEGENVTLSSFQSCRTLFAASSISIIVQLNGSQCCGLCKT